MRNNKGFSLVELIVVIAIMAVLAAVAVIGVSIYIPKAQKAADEQLISEVMQALTLQYYSDEGTSGGFVILTREGVVIDDSERADAFGAAAMKAVFGESWMSEAVLQHEWNTALSGASSTTIEANKILGTASSLTGVAEAVVGGNSPDRATDIIFALTGSEDLKDELSQYESNPDYSTIAANLLVKHLSGEIGNMELDEAGEPIGELSGPSNLVLTYAMLYSMANSDSPYSSAAQDKLNDFDDAMEEISKKEQEDSNNTSVMAELWDALEDITSDDSVFDNEGENPITFGDAYGKYIEKNGTTDINGIVDAMSFVNSSAQEFSDAETLGRADLFSSEAIQNKLNDYQNSNKYGVVIRIDSEGVITVYPETAMPAK